MKTGGAGEAGPDRPTIIRLKSIIGKGAPTRAGTAKAHGEALGPEEAAGAKKAIGVPDGCQFYVFPEATAYFKEKQPSWKARYEEWKKTLRVVEDGEPAAGKGMGRLVPGGHRASSRRPLAAFKQGDSLATRAASGQVLNALAKLIPNLVGGSADLAPSNNTNLKDMGDFGKANPAGPELPLRHPRARHGRHLQRHVPTTAACGPSAPPSWCSPTTCARPSAWRQSQSSR